jgi:hypothetical protein
MHSEVVLFDHAVGPNGRYQLAPADRPSGVIQQESQDIQRPGAKRDDGPIPGEFLPPRGETEPPELETPATVHWPW